MNKTCTKLVAWLLYKWPREEILGWDLGTWTEVLVEYSAATKQAVNQLSYIPVLEELRAGLPKEPVKSHQLVLNLEHQWITNKKGDDETYIACKTSRTRGIVARITDDKDDMPRCSRCLQYLGDCSQGLIISVKEHDNSVIKYVLPC